MMRSTKLHAHLLPSLLTLMVTPMLLAQEATTQANFYEVQVSKDEIYSFTDLQFTGDHASFTSPSGHLALGRTSGGVTVVIVIGEGTVSIEAPEAVQEKFRAVFQAHPLKARFESVYMRLHPKEYDETFGTLRLAKAANDGVFARAKELFDQKFLASYHAGPKAMLPPYKTRVLDFEMPEFGQVSYEEGYWMSLRRVSPYGSVYPARFPNPKQK